MELFWSFILYSFLGFGLEVFYALLTGGRRDRKRTLLLPLCPVYGLGAVTILLLSRLVGENREIRFLLGIIGATVVEYLLAVWYEKGLGVSFWDYSEIPGNLHGRVCLPFSLVWGILGVILVEWVHPAMEMWLIRPIPGVVMATVMFVVAGDLVVSGIMLRITGERACLRWYDGKCIWRTEKKRLS